jgi:hypothetical protein
MTDTVPTRSGPTVPCALGVYALEHPYQAWRLLGSRLPELGGIIICDLRAGRQPYESLSSLALTAPWCPTCALVPTRLPFRKLIEVLESLPRSCLKLPIELGDTQPQPRWLLAEVTRRPAPTPAQIAEYIARRVSCSWLFPTFAACLQRGADSGASRSYLSRKLKNRPPFTARDWAAVGQLVSVLQSTRWPAGRLAREHGLDPRTLRAWVARYLGLPWNTAQQLVGWEWIVEAALRRGKYVPDRLSEAPAKPMALEA